MSHYIPALLRQEVYDRANGTCEYCLIPQEVSFVSLEVDHIIARKHGGETESKNLALACSLCNKYKGSDLTSIDPESNIITPLFHPRIEKWIEHFHLNEAKIVPITPTGRVTAALLQLNQSERVAERKLLISVGVLQIP